MQDEDEICATCKFRYEHFFSEPCRTCLTASIGEPDHSWEYHDYGTEEQK